MSSVATERQLLIGEWACLGIMYPEPTHGFAIAARLKPDGDIGRVWSLSRALTYRSLDQLQRRDLVRAVGVEPGQGGPDRTIITPTRTGRARFRRWLGEPVEHLRDLRSELLLKLVLAEQCGIDVGDTIAAQRRRIEQLAAGRAMRQQSGDDAIEHDVVAMWRDEATNAALRFLDRIAGGDERAVRMQARGSSPASSLIGP